MAFARRLCIRFQRSVCTRNSHQTNRVRRPIRGFAILNCFQDLPVRVSASSPPCRSCSATSTTCATTLAETTNRIGWARMRRYRWCRSKRSKFKNTFHGKHEPGKKFPIRVYINTFRWRFRQVCRVRSACQCHSRAQSGVDGSRLPQRMGRTVDRIQFCDGKFTRVSRIWAPARSANDVWCAISFTPTSQSSMEIGILLLHYTFYNVYLIGAIWGGPGADL